METAMAVMPRTGVVVVLLALNLGVATYYRRRRGALPVPAQRQPSPRALSAVEESNVLELLHGDRFVDQSPAEIVATLLGEKKYLCSERTMYRILAKHHEVKERRDQLRHPAYRKPELLATGPNQVWSWDITRLKTEVKWVYLYLYVVLDIFSRYVVGWMLAEHENSTHAKRLIQETCDRHHIMPGQLVVHSDSGPPMRAKQLSQLMADLDIRKSVSRPHVSDDNPFSESQFKTLKYHPTFPERFAGIIDGLAFCRQFFPWYNDEHHHSALCYLTPQQVHYGQAQEALQRRLDVMLTAYARHPERFISGPPRLAVLPQAVYINPPIPLSVEPVIMSPSNNLSMTEPVYAVEQKEALLTN